MLTHHNEKMYYSIVLVPNKCPVGMTTMQDSEKYCHAGAHRTHQLLLLHMKPSVYPLDYVRLYCTPNLYYLDIMHYASDF